MSSLHPDISDLQKMNLYSDPESGCIYSGDYGEHFEIPTASVGSVPDENGFRGGAGGDSTHTISQPEATIDEL